MRELMSPVADKLKVGQTNRYTNNIGFSRKKVKLKMVKFYVR